MTPLAQYTQDARRIVEVAAAAGGMSDPVAFDPDEFTDPLLGRSARGRFVPIDGVFVRDWDPEWRRLWPAVLVAVRVRRKRERALPTAWLMPRDPTSLEPALEAAPGSS